MFQKEKILQKVNLFEVNERKRSESSQRNSIRVKTQNITLKLRTLPRKNRRNVQRIP